MTIVGGFDVHRKQITFDYVASETGEVRSGQICPATRKTVQSWLGKHCPGGDAEFALEACTGWRFVAEELTAMGAIAHLADAAETAGLRGPKKRAKTDRVDARLLRTLLWEGRLPEAVIPPAQVLEVRTVGRLYCADGGTARLAAAHPCAAVSPGLPADQGGVDQCWPRGAGQRRTVGSGPAVRGYRAAARRRAHRPDRAAANPIGGLRPPPARVSGAAAPVWGGTVGRGDPVGRDWRCAPLLQLRAAGALRRPGHHRVLLRRANARWGTCPAKVHPSCAGWRSKPPNPPPVPVRPTTPTTRRSPPDATASAPPWR
jgi:hypothetical protein